MGCFLLRVLSMAQLSKNNFKILVDNLSLYDKMKKLHFFLL